MAVLSDTARAEIWSQAMTDFSKTRIEVPVSKTELRSLINFMDGQLETAEASIFSGLPTGDGKDWILANSWIGKELLARIEEKRREEI